jgi:hypothetical protein
VAQTPATPQPAPPTPPAAKPAAAHPPHARTALPDAPVDPLDHAGAALDARADRKAERDAARAEARERKRAEKQAAREAAEKRKQEEREERESRRAEELAESPEPKPEQATKPPRKKKERKKRELADPAEVLVARLPTIKPVYAAIISGVLAGLAVVLLALGASRGCEAVRDTSSCGGGVGLLATVALLAIEVMIGANLLKAWQISDPVSTSFLGVGIVATIAMLTFLDKIDSPWMLLVIPVMTAVFFAVSWWVTVRFVDEHPMASEIDSEHGEPDFPEAPADADQDEDSNR